MGKDVKLNSVHFTNRWPVVSYHPKPHPPSLSSDPTCPWLGIIWKFTIVSSILLELLSSHKTPGFNIHSLIPHHVPGTGKTSEGDSLCPQRALQRCPHTQNLQGGVFWSSGPPEPVPRCLPVLQHKEAAIWVTLSPLPPQVELTKCSSHGGLVHAQYFT